MPENGHAGTVHILLVTCGRRKADGLPEGAAGAALLCYAAARDERTAVSETVQVLRAAGLNPLEVESYGTRESPEGLVLGAEEQALMQRASDENAVIVATTEVLDTLETDGDEDDEEAR